MGANELAIAVQGFFRLHLKLGVCRQVQLLAEIGANLTRDVGRGWCVAQVRILLANPNRLYFNRLYAASYRKMPIIEAVA